MNRQNPNICISGVPGTGKSTLAKVLAASLPGFEVLDLGEVASKNGSRLSYDETRNAWEIDEQRMARKLRPTLDNEGGKLLDWIHADFWVESDVDLVVTLRTDNTVLYDRYKERGYRDEKIQENLDAEIMGVIAEENRERYDGELELFELQSDTDSEQASNVQKIIDWVSAWKLQREHAS